MRRVAVSLALAGCGEGALVADAATTPAADARLNDAARSPTADARVNDASPPTPDAASPPLDATPHDASPPTPCATRVQYGARWIRPPERLDDLDVAPGRVTWDGVCTPDAAGNSFATLSNGWQPYFSGPSGCRIALDTTGDCGQAAACATRVTYGAGWRAPPDHPQAFDDVSGAVFAAGACRDAWPGVRAIALSNGWVPHFDGECAVAFAWTGCGGVYTNPVIPFDCPDPGVLRDGDRYVMACTSGGAPDAFPLFESADLVRWTPRGHILPRGAWPAWVVGDLWAPEVHRVGGRYIAYFSARSVSGQLALGAATADTPLGPFTALDRPLLDDPAMGLIDASAFVDPRGGAWLSWKEDGNAVGRSTPIHVQALTPDGLRVTGPRATAITNDLPWEGALVEGQFIVERGGRFFMFYSANAYYDARYAVGVARAETLLGPWTKRGDPILASNAAWSGPGHGSVVVAPSGAEAFVYHAWVGGQAGGGPGRLVLVDSLTWGADGWPSLPGAPTFDTRPRP